MFSEFKLLIFGDFKKHTFKYQFLSSALAVDGVQTLSIESAKDSLADRIGELNNYVLKYIKKERQVPQLVVLRNF